MTNLLESLKGQTVALDTMIFIYAFEERPVYLSFLRNFFLKVEKGEMEATTSTISLMECLVYPYRKKKMGLAAQYMVLFRNFPHLSVLSVTDEIAERAAFLRAFYNLKTPDAIQLATALISRSQAFLTNDEKMPEINGVRLFVLSRYIK